MDAESLREFDELAAATAEALWEAQVIIGGVTYPACVPPQPPRALLGLGGEEETEDLVVWIRKAELTAAPARDSLLTYGGRRYGIRSISGGEVDAAWALRCEPKS
jgi:hypothetical protein